MADITPAETNRDRWEQWKRIPSPAEARKAIVAFIGLAFTIATVALGLEGFIPEEHVPWVNLFTGTCTLLGVFVIPNRPAPAGTSKRVLGRGA